MIIVGLSGGKASAYCAKWAFENYPKDEIILYFNDTKWEDPDLYRFLNDLSNYFNHPITYDSDGRSPEELFFHNKALASNYMPFCSRVLKAERLQKFYKDGDTIIFGIGNNELHRAKRLVIVYNEVAQRTNKWPKLVFPLIKDRIESKDVDAFLKSAGIKQQRLYDLGFTHNNCGGGCVRAGKASWKLLLDKLPEVYAERERVEEAVRNFLQKDVSYMKDETLKEFRWRIQSQIEMDFGKPDEFECIGICSQMN